MDEIDVLVPGLPRPQGSKRHVGNGVIVDANAEVLAPWRATVASAVFKGRPCAWKLDGAMVVTVIFAFPMLKRQRRGSGVLYKPTRPDLDKLLRAVLDACTDGGAWHDDAQVSVVHAIKVHSEFVGISLNIKHAHVERVRVSHEELELELQTKG